ncbi:hypothetical protein ACHAXR_012645 [Thalassiosira sp. AJA248-18]
MNTMPTARRGRTYYKQGANDNRGLGGVCSILFIVVLLVAAPVILIGSERSRHTRYITLSDALNSDTVELNHGIASKALHNLRPGTLVHGTSTHIDTISSDGEMKVAIPGALTLRRNTEYCQWQELQSQNCQTCTRTVRANDGSSKEESYQCNCVKQYDYIKAWRNYRINSLLFDQPGAHYNPQRDPMPSRMFVGEDAKLTFHEGAMDSTEDDINDQHQKTKSGGGSVSARLDPNMLSSGVRNQPYRHIEFTPNGSAPPPSFFSRLFSFFGPTRRTRFEPLQLLKDTPDSPAAIQDNFVYVGQGGYFFSAHESSTSSKLFNYFAQYLEGSLFDWQIGDLMPSCTAGDIRFSYQVQDPTVVSVLGQLGYNQNSNALQITPRTMNGIGNDEKAATIGLVHSGSHSAQAMLMAEDSDSKNKALIIRGLLFLWSIPASRLVGVALGRELGDSSFAVQAEGVMGIFFTLLGAVWLVIWGETFGAMETTMLFFMGGTFGYFAYKSSVRKGAGRWWHAVWCRIGKWANAPPEWREEDSYIPSPSKEVGGGSKVS